MMSEKRVRVGVVGLAFGAEFIPIYQRHPGARVQAICQRNEEKLNHIGDQFGVEQRYSKYEDLLKDPQIDFVHINSPIPDHAPMSIAALKAGKHVMCTVPMATTIEECQQICELVKSTGLRYMMAETVVYSREFLFIKEMYEKGELGKIQHLAASHPQDMDGWPGLLGTDDPNALRHARRQPLLGPDQRSRGVRIVLRLGHGARGHPEEVGQQVRGRKLPHQNQGFRRHRPHLAHACTMLPGSTARASTFTARRKASSGH